MAHHVTEDEAFHIELLIGADQYWNLVKDDIIRGNGTTAIKSKLGYLLSGPVYGTKLHSIDSSMMNVMVSHKLEEQDLEKLRQLELRK